MLYEKKVFLGGTCNGTTWRDDLIQYLKIDYFNPVVKDWTSECQENEYKEKEICMIHYYHITSEMKGVFSIAEVIDSVHNKNKITILCVDPTGFEESELKSLRAVIDLVKKREGHGYFETDIRTSAEILNSIHRLDQYKRIKTQLEENE